VSFAFLSAFGSAQTRRFEQRRIQVRSLSLLQLHPRKNQMPMQTRYPPRSLRASCALSVVAALLAVAPALTQAQDPAKSPAKPMPMPSGQMDHSKMGGTKGMDGMDHSKMGGMKGMEGISKTGNVDHDFAANMRMHHQMAVEMSEAHLKSGKDPKMKDMARKIIADQKKEIAMFDQWMASHGKSAAGAMPKK